MRHIFLCYAVGSGKHAARLVKVCKMRKILVLVAAALAGCGNAQQVYTDTLNRCVGLPADAVMGRLGLPDSDQTVMGHHVLTWNHGGSIVLLNGNTAQVSCKLQFAIDETNFVIGWQADGNVAGCQPYIAKLTKLRA